MLDRPSRLERLSSRARRFRRGHLPCAPASSQRSTHSKTKGETRTYATRPAVGRAIRDLRQGGSLLISSEIQPGVRVFSRPQEPEFEAMPGRLDPTVPDDRILAAAFELQRGHPADAVVLVTGDVNLQTKAELARLPFAEPPPTPLPGIEPEARAAATAPHDDGHRTSPIDGSERTNDAGGHGRTLWRSRQTACCRPRSMRREPHTL